MILYISDRSVNSPVMEGKDGRRCPSTYIHTYITNITNPCEKPHPDARILSIPPPPFPSQQLYRSNLPNLHICIPLSPESPHHKTQTHVWTTTTRTSHFFRIPEFHSISISTISHPTPKLSNPRPRGRSAGTGPRPRGGGPLLGVKKRVCQLVYSR